MSTQTLVLWLVLIGLTVFAILIYLTLQGHIIALVLLAVLGSVSLVILGATITLLHDRIASEKQQQAFADNMQENLGIMQALQTVQNKQNTSLLQQLGQVSRLPQPINNNPLLIEDTSIFDELAD